MNNHPNLNYLYVHSDQLGYGRLGVRLAEALAQMGVTVYDNLPGVTATEDPVMSHLSTGSRSGICKTICWVSVPTHATGWWEGQRATVFTMWEATKLPESFRESLDAFDTLIVPSDQNVELFSKYHPKVRRALLGIDTDYWSYRERTPPTSEFRFLIAGSGRRKGVDLAVAAFNKVFPDGSWGDGPIPILQLKSRKGREFYGKRIEIISGTLDAAAEREVYANAHVYLQPSRGEGFGLQPLQAIAQGCPTILTDAHGHQSFSHLGMPLSTTMEHAAYFIFGDAGEWWLPSLDDLCDWMLYCYENYDQACADAKVASDVAREQFTWRACAEQFVDALGGVEALDEPLIGRTTWNAPPRRQYLVVTNRNWKADICGVEHFFAKGERYYESADVKRIMFEAGLLDPAFLPLEHEDDLGLTPEQVERLGVYHSAHERCDRCGHKMNCEQCA